MRPLQSIPPLDLHLMLGLVGVHELKKVLVLPDLIKGDKDGTAQGDQNGIPAHINIPS